MERGRPPAEEEEEEEEKQEEEERREWGEEEGTELEEVSAGHELAVDGDGGGVGRGADGVEERAGVAVLKVDSSLN